MPSTEISQTTRHHVGPGPTNEDRSVVDVFDRFPHSLIDHDNRHFYAGLVDRRLIANRCRARRTWQFPPRSMCAECWSTSMAHEVVSGRGTVTLTTVLRSIDQVTGRDGESVALVTVELEEQAGLRISAPMVNCSADGARVGMQVEIVWPDHLPMAFQPCGTSTESAS